MKLLNGEAEQASGHKKTLRTYGIFVITAN